MCNANYKKIDNVVVIKLKGELISQDCKKLKDDLKQYISIDKYFVFDLEDLSMIDSSGLGYIIHTLKTVSPQNGDVRISNLCGQPKVIFEITRVNSIFKQYDTQDDAVQSYSSIRGIL